MGAEEQVAVKPFVPAGQRIYCIGDIHGRLDLLQQLHQLILEDAADHSGAKNPRVPG